jgi:hypothetical protein
MNKIIAYIRKDEWSPYVAGVGLGLVAILSMWLANQTLGASGAFESVVGALGKSLDVIGRQAPPSLINNSYWVNLMRPEISWEVWLILGTIVGGGIGALTSGTWKLRTMPDKQWTAVFGKSRVTRWVLAFLGAIVLEVGAGLANGCTSGLAISGGLQLAPSAFLFMAGMFAAGIPTALIIYGRRY